MLCKNCREREADVDTGFCGGLCMQEWLNKRRNVCIICGREFVVPSSRKYTHECHRCYYKRHFAADKKPEIEDPGPDKIEEVIAEQRRIREATGRKLTYGEIMAAKAAKKG